MSFLLPLLIGLALGAIVGGLVAFVALSRRGTGADAGREAPDVVAARHELALERQSSEAAAELSAVQSALAAEQATSAGLREQLDALRQSQREALEQQRAEQAEKQRQAQAEHRVLEALAPVAKNLAEMQQKVTQLELQRSQQHGELAQQLKTATESEERLRSTAETLASALRSNSTRGVWGETQLRSVVEAAGLLERVDFDTQSSIAADSGARRPDMVVHLPGGKNIAVDAKVPFNAYLDASAIPVAADGAEGARREGLMKDHVRAVRDHITTLGAKAYWTGLDSSPELTIAFIPSESLISSAVEADPGLLEFAFSKRVALASPVTLWSVLKTVAFSWQQDVLTNEAKTLFDLSRELYTRLSKTADHIEKLGRSVERTAKDYNAFVGSLERQVLPTARKIGALNEEKILAAVDPVEEPVRRLAAPELVAALEAGGDEPAEEGAAEITDGEESEIFTADFFDHAD